MDKLQVINTALMMAGLPLAASLDDCDWNASIVFDQEAESLLRAHPWNFARKLASLEPAASPPAFGYAYAYLLPADYLTMVDVHCQNDMRSPEASYEMAGTCLYTSVSPCHARYTCRLINPQLWPSDFAIACAANIAQTIIALSGQNMQAVPQLAQLAQMKIAQAQIADARESRSRLTQPRFDALAARGNG